MKQFLESFSNREISVVFWTFLIVIIFFFMNISGSKHLVKSFFARKLVFIYGVMAVYLSTIIYFLYRIKLWETSLFKDFIFWLITSAFVMLLNFNKLQSSKDFKNIFLQLLTISAIAEFIAGNYNFSLIKEMLLIPAVTFISLLAIVAEQKKRENARVIKLLNSILSFLGFFILGYVIFRLIQSPLELFSLGNLKAFLFTPLLTIFFIPFVFILVVYSKYELIFMNINHYKFLSKRRKSEIKLAIFMFGNINLKYLKNAHNMTIWRKPELQNENKIRSYIKKEIKNDITFKG